MKEEETNQSSWMEWCRLCARKSMPGDEEFVALDNLPHVVDLMQRLNCVTDVEELPTHICGPCWRITNQLADWTNRCSLVHQMYDEIKTTSWDDDSEERLRKKYGLVEPLEEPFTLVDVEFVGSRESTYLENNEVDSLEMDISLKEEQSQGMETEDPEVDIEYHLHNAESASEEDSLDNVNDIDDDSSESSSLKCRTCDATFGSASQYKRHMLKEHNPANKHDCTQCSKLFKSVRALKIHMRSHQSNVHACSFCCKKFSSSANLMSHMRQVHRLASENNFICEECGKSCPSKGSLKDHMYVHSDAKPFKCDSCPMAFKNMPRLKTHQDTHNGTQYICPHCGLQLNTKITLKMHMVVHSDEKQFKCKFCGNEYKRAKALKAHLILHSGLRPYSCQWCDKTFANGSNCRKHKKLSHPTELAALEADGIKQPPTIVPKLTSLMQQ